MTVLLGVDCATQPHKTGLALGELRDGRVVVTRCAPGSRLQSTARTILDWLEGCEDVLLAFDAPLGWPVALGEELHLHWAGEGLSSAPDILFRRAADESIHKRLRKLPLEVGASWLARTAVAALGLLDEIRKLSDRPIPLAWEPRESDRWRVIEVYPAATRIAHGAPSGSGSVVGLVNVLNCSAVRDVITHCEDAGDACVCALAAADFLAGRSVAPDDVELAKREGWIWAPDLQADSDFAPGWITERQPPGREDRETMTCLACKRGLPKTPPRICPECGHEFGGMTWAGIDAHWKARHDNVMSYEQFWASLCPEHKGRRPPRGERS